ncbi:MAG: hypothetical protein H7255_04770 [Ramlibacter sp.]|nr:hypothetical protein [Ramlibacter sp.]
MKSINSLCQSAPQEFTLTENLRTACQEFAPVTRLRASFRASAGLFGKCESAQHKTTESKGVASQMGIWWEVTILMELDKYGYLPWLITSQSG